MNRRLAAWGTALVAALVVLPASSVAAAELLPAEPGAIVLPPARTLQAVAGDVDGDGDRELVRLVQDDSEATVLEVWRQGSGRWVLAGPIPVLSGQSGSAQRNKVYAGAPARLFPRRLGRAGGVLEELKPSPDSWLSIAPIDQLLGASSPAGGFAPAIAGAVRDPSNQAALVTSAAGFRARFRGPPGSRALIFGMGPTAQSVVPPSGLLSVAVEPPKSGAADRPIDAGLIVLTPAGHAYVADWNVEVLTTPPEVVTTAVTPFLSSQVRVSGHVPAGSRLTLNGRAVAVAPDGRFGAEVCALPWPMDVRLEASDPIGNRSTRLLSVVGFLDYRRLPWIPIVVLVTLIVAVGLFLRGPRARRLPIGDGDARLEEIEEP